MTKRIPTSLFAILLTLTLTLLIASLSSCSAVFTAGISGTVETKDGTRDVPVQGVNVFVYTDKSQRDSDFNQFKAGSLTRPSQGSGYVATTTTDPNGQFTVNKIVWKTNGSEFGKTADVNTVYLIFYHEDYKPERWDATIISDSTNSSNIKMTLEPSKDYATINVRILDVSTDLPMSDQCTVEYTVTSTSDGKNTTDTVNLTGSGTLSVKFPKDDKSTTIKFKLTSPGTYWKMVKSDGSKIEDQSDPISITKGTNSVTLYMKNYEITLPGFYGYISTNIDDKADESDSDNKTIKLAYKTKTKSRGDDGYTDFDAVTNANIKTHSELIATTSQGVVKYRHGKFENVGNSDNYRIVINEDTFPNIELVDAGKYVSVKLKITFEEKEKGHEFTYNSNSDGNLGYIKIEN